MTNLAGHLSHLLLYMFPFLSGATNSRKVVDLSEEQGINDKTLAKTEAEKEVMLQMGHCLERAEHWCQAQVTLLELNCLYYAI